MSDPTTKLMDVDEGLKRLGGNKKLYVKLLNSFINQKTYDDLLAYVNGGEVENACSAAHAIKGMAANLSLKALYEDIVTLETLLKQGVIDDNAMQTVVQSNELTKEAINQFILENS